MEDKNEELLDEVATAKLKKMSNKQLEEEIRKAHEKHEACVSRLTQVGKSSWEYQACLQNILSSERAIVGLTLYLLNLK